MASPSPFIIEPDAAEEMRKSLNLPSLPSLLPSLLPSARLLARPPISLFRVSAAALGLSGRIYLGANLEFPNLPLHQTIHAEQFLVANASLHGEPSLPFIAVSAPPCGHCRQFLQELRSPSQIQILIKDSAFRPLSHLLPDPFGPSDLLERNAPLLLEERWNELEEGGEFEGEEEERGRKEAVRAARVSHAPYSGSAAGFAIVDGEGRVFGGSYMESAAYNPSLGPVQAAMVGYVVGGGEGIVGGVLAEGEGAKVSQEEMARVFFGAVAPGAWFRVSRFRVRGN